MARLAIRVVRISSSRLCCSPRLGSDVLRRLLCSCLLALGLFHVCHNLLQQYECVFSATALLLASAGGQQQQIQTCSSSGMGPKPCPWPASYFSSSSTSSSNSFASGGEASFNIWREIVLFFRRGLQLHLITSRKRGTSFF